MTVIDIDSPLGKRLLAAGLRLEDGQIANMNTFRLPARPCFHTRIVGEGRTLCGRSWMPGGWQFCSQGTYGERAPHNVRDRDACKSCAKHPVLARTLAAEDAKLDALRGVRRRYAVR